MSEWLSLLPVVAWTALLVLLPGLLIGIALRLRGMLLWGFAPAAGIAALAVGALGVGILGVRWTWWSAAVAVLVLAVVAAAIGFPLRSGLLAPPAIRRPILLIIAIVAGALIGAVRMGALIGDPQNLSQTNDATFHLNALKYIQDSGSASSLDLSGMVGSSSFYPAAWHAVASLVMDVTGVGVAEAANATSLVIAGPIWTLSITSFVWCATRGRRVATAAAALMAPALFAFPFYMLDFGVLYPYALSLALLPGVLAVLVTVLRGDGSLRGRPRELWAASVATSVGLAALALAQPAVLLNWVIGAVILVCGALLRGWSGHSPRSRRLRTVVIIGLLVAALLVWLALTRISSSALWGPQKNALRAALDLLLNSSAGSGPAFSMSILAVIGMVTALRRAELRWLAVYAAAISLLAITAISVQDETVRALLTAWYADPHRFVAMMPLVVIPLAAVGVDGLVRRIGARRPVVIVVAAAVLAIVVAETLLWTALRAMSAEGSYVRDSSSYLSSDEYELLESLPDYVEPGDRVLGNPSAGAAFGYALSGVDVVPRTWSMPEDEDFQLLREELVEVADDPAVCAAVQRMSIDYVLDFGSSSDGAGKWEMPGLTGFSEHPGFQLVARSGDASLWRIEKCSAE